MCVCVYIYIQRERESTIKPRDLWTSKPRFSPGTTLIPQGIESIVIELYINQVVPKMLMESSLVNWPRSQSQDRRFKVHFSLP